MSIIDLNAISSEIQPSRVQNHFTGQVNYPYLFVNFRVFVACYNRKRIGVKGYNKH